MPVKGKITILIAPLDWGLGHATRCIPIIHQLIKLHCNVVIASEGKQQNLLKTEFPSQKFIHLPGYKIQYSNNKRLFYLKIICQIPKIIKAINFEKKWLRQLISREKIDAVISDNRYGLFHSSIPSVFLTHQLTIKANNAIAESILRKLNYRYINQFTACWIPDEKGINNLAGQLSHPPILPAVPVKYIGVLTRFNENYITAQQYKLLVVLSGPEPQRTHLEKKLLSQFKDFTEPVLFVRGLPGEEAILPGQKNIIFHNHLPAPQLEIAFRQSEYIISRTGYTTIMDICKLKKKSILIPTPGQTEQEYLAGHLQKQGFCITATQDDFNLRDKLAEAKSFSYQFPDVDMEKYKTVVNEFVRYLSLKKV